MYRKANHLTYFTPFLDRNGEERVWVCTIYNTETRKFTRGVSICSLMDLPDSKEGRQLAYNNASRVDAGRESGYIVLHDAWSSISYLDPLELARFSEMYFVRLAVQQQPFPHGYIIYENELTVGEINFFNRKIEKENEIINDICKSIDMIFNPQQGKECVYHG